MEKWWFLPSKNRHFPTFFASFLTVSPVFFDVLFQKRANWRELSPKRGGFEPRPIANLFAAVFSGLPSLPIQGDGQQGPWSENREWGQRRGVVTEDLLGETAEMWAGSVEPIEPELR